MQPNEEVGKHSSFRDSFILYGASPCPLDPVKMLSINIFKSKYLLFLLAIFIRVYASAQQNPTPLDQSRPPDSTKVDFLSRLKKLEVEEKKESALRFNLDKKSIKQNNLLEQIRNIMAEVTEKLAASRLEPDEGTLAPHPRFAKIFRAQPRQIPRLASGLSANRRVPRGLGDEHHGTARPRFRLGR